MPEVSDMTQYELIQLLKAASAELVEREEKALWMDEGCKLAEGIAEKINEYDEYNEKRPIQ